MYIDRWWDIDSDKTIVRVLKRTASCSDRMPKLLELFVFDGPTALKKGPVRRMATTASNFSELISLASSFGLHDILGADAKDEERTIKEAKLTCADRFRPYVLGFVSPLFIWFQFEADSCLTSHGYITSPAPFSIRRTPWLS